MAKRFRLVRDRQGLTFLLTSPLVILLIGPASTAGQGRAIGYAAEQLDCVRFSEFAETDILTEAGGRIRRQTSRRSGIWQFRARVSADGVMLEGWLDSLTISRRSDETVISPDTDGLLGGRYRGTLSRTGEYASSATPFVPEDVAEVAEMHNALDDIFPPLPSRALREGESWTDSLGVTVTRLADSSSSGVRLQRFGLKRREQVQVAPGVADTLPLELQQTSEEHGHFVWHPLHGLVRRQRTVGVETTVPPSRTVRQAVRSEVEQRITLVRDLRRQACPPSGG